MLLLIFLALCMVALTNATPLDDYVWKPDPHYEWKYMGDDWILHGRSVNNKHSWTGYVLNMTSQQFLTDADYAPNSEAKSIWWHMFVVVVPDTINWKQNGTLYLTGHGIGYRPTSNLDEDIAMAASLAMSSGSVTGILFQVPNEDITFASDPLQMSRGEDEIIAFTWDRFLRNTSETQWPLYLPMVKAAVRAMDTMTDFIANSHPELGVNLEYFVVSGASKRGWTTWLTGIVDPKRVVGIVPIVLDIINFVTTEHHQFRSYGGWSWAINDYWEMGVMGRVDTPEMTQLQQIIDPFFYLDRLTMPKLIVNAVLDEFMQPDDTHYWWSSMPEPKHFLMTPNAEHSEATGLLEIVPAISSWIEYLLQKETVPTFSWDIAESTGEITVELDRVGKVHKASVWYGYSCGVNKDDGIQRRDFRIMSLDNPCMCGVITDDGYCLNTKSFWKQEPLNATLVNGKRVYKALVPPPTDGRYVAFFVDIKYEAIHFQHPSSLQDIPVAHDKPGQLEFTSEVSVLPNTFPYPACAGSDCNGHLL